MTLESKVTLIKALIRKVSDDFVKSAELPMEPYQRRRCFLIHQELEIILKNHFGENQANKEEDYIFKQQAKFIDSLRDSLPL